MPSKRRVRLAYLVSHPIQYQAPLLRRLVLEPDIDLLVLFGSDFSARGYQDKGFGVEVRWDVPLLEGYPFKVIPAWHDPGTVSAWTPLSRGMLSTLRTADGAPAFDALWIHGYASVNSLQAMLAAKWLGIPVLLRAESWLSDRARSGSRLFLKRLFFRMLRPFVAAVLPIGSHNATYWRGYLGPGIAQFPVPYAVDNRYFAVKTQAALPSLAKLREKLNLPSGRPVILFASKLQERKNAGDLLLALRGVLDRSRTYAPPMLVLVGDGEEREHLEQQTLELGLTENVRFAGFRNQSELPSFFALADVFVLPARHEPWGLITNEAMASGTAVVLSSDVGAAADLVTERVEGCVYPTGDIGQLTAALEYVLELPTRARVMGEAAARRVAEWDFEADIRGLRRALAFVTHRISA